MAAMRNRGALRSSGTHVAPERITPSIPIAVSFDGSTSRATGSPEVLDSLAARPRLHPTALHIRQHWKLALWVLSDQVTLLRQTDFENGIPQGLPEAPVQP